MPLMRLFLFQNRPPDGGRIIVRALSVDHVKPRDGVAPASKNQAEGTPALREQQHCGAQFLGADKDDTVVVFLGWLVGQDEAVVFRVAGKHDAAGAFPSPAQCIFTEFQWQREQAHCLLPRGGIRQTRIPGQRIGKGRRGGCRGPAGSGDRTDSSLRQFQFRDQLNGGCTGCGGAVTGDQRVKLGAELRFLFRVGLVERLGMFQHPHRHTFAGIVLIIGDSESAFGGFFGLRRRVGLGLGVGCFPRLGSGLFRRTGIPAFDFAFGGRP